MCKVFIWNDGENHERGFAPARIQDNHRQSITGVCRDSQIQNMMCFSFG